MRRLNTAPWVPDASGELHPPSLVMFDALGWKPNPFLLSKIAFKPPIIDQLAKEAGIDPAALDLLKKLGITSVAELTSRLGITEQPPEPEVEPEEPAVDESSGDVYGDAKDLYGDDMPDTLADRPVGLSRTQFDCARERGAAYWLYVVEHATESEQTRILRIQDPVAHARTFTFDSGWIEIARTEPPA